LPLNFFEMKKQLSFLTFKMLLTVREE
jgi:hypothetical protein